jgi:hypothetical protein
MSVQRPSGHKNYSILYVLWKVKRSSSSEVVDEVKSYEVVLLGFFIIIILWWKLWNSEGAMVGAWLLDMINLFYKKDFELYMKK